MEQERGREARRNVFDWPSRTRSLAGGAFAHQGVGWRAAAYALGAHVKAYRRVDCDHRRDIGRDSRGTAIAFKRGKPVRARREEREVRPGRMALEGDARRVDSELRSRGAHPADGSFHVVDLSWPGRFRREP